MILAIMFVVLGIVLAVLVRLLSSPANTLATRLQQGHIQEPLESALKAVSFRWNALATIYGVLALIGIFAGTGLFFIAWSETNALSHDEPQAIGWGNYALVLWMFANTIHPIILYFRLLRAERTPSLSFTRSFDGPDLVAQASGVLAIEMLVHLFVFLTSLAQLILV